MVAAVVGALVTLLIAYAQQLITQNPVDELKHEVIEIKEQVKALNLDSRLAELEKRLKEAPEEAQ